jgi:hypothetical protein
MMSLHAAEADETVVNETTINATAGGKILFPPRS